MRWAGTLAPERLPATTLFDLLYCLVLDDSKERAEQREQLDEVLASAVTGGKPDRASWGLRPEHQRRMRAARDAGGKQAAVARPRVAGKGRG